MNEQSGEGAPAVECAVWWAVPPSDPGFAEALPPAERARARRFRLAADRSRYVTGRVLARTVIGARLSMDPAAIDLDTTCRRCGADHGKPTVTNAPSGRAAAFSLAHAPGSVVLAVTDAAEVGVDVESVEAFAPHRQTALSAELLSSEERAAYERLPAPRRAHALAVWWTRKEAVLKATGEGLAIPPSHLGVTGPEVEPAVTAWHPRVWSSGVAPPSRLHDLMAPPGLVASVAVLSARRLVVHHHDGDALLREVASEA